MFTLHFSLSNLFWILLLVQTVLQVLIMMQLTEYAFHPVHATMELILILMEYAKDIAHLAIS
jgi:hypothetical protein